MINKYLTILFLLPHFLQAQQSKTFKITGRSDYYNNQELTVSVGLNPLYNDCTLGKAKADTGYNVNFIVQNRGFELYGTLRYPHPLNISYYDEKNNSGHGSYFYFIEDGDIHVNVDDLAKNKNLGNGINGKSNREYQYLKKLYSQAVDTSTRRINNMQRKQKMMHTYIVSHPNSYVALWDLVLDYAFAGNVEDKRSILKNTGLFSPLVKKSKTYRALVADLEKDITINEQLTIGLSAPNFTLNDTLGKAVSLNDLRGKYVLLDFWASWCLGCREDNPNLVKAFNIFKDKGFTVLGVSLDKPGKKDAWLKAIHDDGLTWTHVNDLNHEVTLQFGVKTIPANLLIAPDGKILARNISGDDLQKILAGILK